MSLPSASRLTEIISSAVESLGYEFVACEMLPQGTRMLLRIYIDSQEGVTIKDCEIVSRQLGAVLDVENLMPGKYYLEVSSPGSDRLLVTKDHYQRFIGHRVKLKLRSFRDGRRNFSGLLEEVNNANITIVADGETYILPISDIEKANVVPDK